MKLFTCWLALFMSLVTSTFELRLGLHFPLNGLAGAVSGRRCTAAHSHGQLQFKLRPSLACSVFSLGNGTALQWLWQPVTLCSWVRLHHKTFALLWSSLPWRLFGRNLVFFIFFIFYVHPICQRLHLWQHHSTSLDSGLLMNCAPLAGPGVMSH